MDIAVNPALVVALGGTGQNIVNRFRRRVRQRVGTDRLPLLEYLYIDTDRGNRDAGEQTEDGIPIGLSPQVAAELADLSSRPAMELELSAQISEDGLNRLRRGTLGGAQGFRQLGHVSFLASQSLRELHTLLRERLGNLIEARDQFVNQYLPELDPKYLRVRLQGAGPKVFVYVVASAGGGTGSSTMIDLGYFIRRALREGGYESECKTIAIACIASSAFAESHQYRYNSAGVMTELNHYIRRPAYRAAYPLAFPGDPLRPDLPPTERMSGIAAQLPYDYQYLAQPATMHGGSLDPDNPPQAMSKLEQKVAELILSDTVFAAPPGKMEYDRTTQPPTPPEIVSRVLKGEVDSRRVDFAGRARAIKYDGRYPTDLMTFGVTTREFPAAMHHVLAFGRAVRELAGRWTQTPALDSAAGPDDLGHPVANSILSDWIERLALRKDEKQYAEHRARPAGDDKLLAALLQLDEVDPREQLKAVAALPEVEGQQVDPQQWQMSRRGAIDQLFQSVADTPPVGSPGSLHARLRDRRDALAGWGEPGYPARLSIALLDLAFDAEAGAGLALALADRLAARIANELAYVELCLAEPVAAAAEGGPPAPDQDWLLMGWHGAVAGPVDTRGVQAEVWDHANRRLLQNVLEAKVVVLRRCGEAVRRMRERLVNLKSYFEKWRDRAPDPNDPDLQLTVDERDYVLREDKLIEQFARLDGLRDPLQQTLQRVSLYRGLRDDVARGLPAEVEGQPALLVAGLPLDRRLNRPDFSHLEEIEAALFDAIGSRRDGPYQQEVIDLLERHASEAGTRLPNLQAEASPLLQFDSNNPGYAIDCRFGGDIELWQFLSAHDSLNHGNFAANVERQQGGFRFQDTPETKMTSVDTMIPSVITIVRHRMGMVTPLINGYDEGTVGRMMQTDKAVTDVRIKPPLNPNLLWQAGFQIFGGLILGNGVIFSLDDDRFVFSYTIRDQAGFTRPQPVKLPMAFEEAYELLARNERERGELDAQIRAKVYELQDGITERLEEMIPRLGRLLNENAPDAVARRLDVWAREGQASGIYLTDIGYEDAINLLTSFALEYGIECKVEFEHRYADHKQVGQPIPDGVAQVAGWYCRYCGQYHGASVPANNRTCSKCRNQPALVG